MKKILFSLLMAAVFAIGATATANAEAIQSTVMEGYVGAMNIKMQLTFDDDNKVTGVYWDSLNPDEKYQLEGTYDGDIMYCEVTLKDKSDNSVFKGEYTVGHMPGIGETNSFEGMWKSVEGTEMDFSVSNM